MVPFNKKEHLFYSELFPDTQAPHLSLRVSPVTLQRKLIGCSSDEGWNIDQSTTTVRCHLRLWECMRILLYWLKYMKTLVIRTPSFTTSVLEFFLKIRKTLSGPYKWSEYFFLCAQTKQIHRQHGCI